MATAILTHPDCVRHEMGDYMTIRFLAIQAYIPAPSRDRKEESL